MYESFSDEAADRKANGFGNELPYTPPPMDIVPGGGSDPDALVAVEQPIVANETRRGPQPDIAHAESGDEPQKVPLEDTAGVDNPAETASGPADSSADLNTPAVPAADGSANNPPVPPAEHPTPTPEEPERPAFDITPFADERPTPAEIPVIADRHRKVVTDALERWSDFVDETPNGPSVVLDYDLSRKTQAIVTDSKTEANVVVIQYDPETKSCEKNDYFNHGGTVLYYRRPHQRYFRAGSVSEDLAHQLYREKRNAERENFQLAYDMGYVPPVGPRQMAHVADIVEKAEPRVFSYDTVDNAIIRALTGAFNPSLENSRQGANELTKHIRSYHDVTGPEPLNIGPIISGETAMSIVVHSESAAGSSVRIECSDQVLSGEVLNWLRRTGQSETGAGYSIHVTTEFNADELQLTITRTGAVVNEQGDIIHQTQQRCRGDTAIARLVRNFLRRPVVNRSDILPKASE